MDVNSLNTAVAASTNSGNSNGNSLISSDFETFLKMLTAQAKYQDPLEPIDNSEYASQLAQFSSVEQQVQTNDLLNSVLSELGTSNLAEFASWIGMEARSSAPTEFDGTPVSLSMQAQTAADEANLVVYDAQLNEVQRIPVGVSETNYQWAGLQDDGSSFPAGTYSFELESRANDAVLGTAAVQSYTRIGEARSENGQSVLILASGAQISPGDITALR